MEPHEKDLPQDIMKKRQEPHEKISSLELSIRAGKSRISPLHLHYERKKEAESHEKDLSTDITKKLKEPHERFSTLILQ